MQKLIYLIFFFLLDFDNLNNDIIRLSILLNFENKKFKIKNSKKYNPPTEDDLEIIKRYNNFDIELYNYYKKKLKYNFI